MGEYWSGPDHPQLEIYNESKHGIVFRSQIDKMNMDSPQWVLGVHYWAAPACATCHMSATATRRLTHDIGTRISWNNRPAISLRPEVADASLGLPGKDLSWRVRRSNMQDVCMSCHQQQWVTNFYIQ
ncbi:MAG: multiheme c-type cytochrome [Desulfatiglandales bacterium]